MPTERVRKKTDKHTKKSGKSGRKWQKKKYAIPANNSMGILLAFTTFAPFWMSFSPHLRDIS